MNKDQWIVAGGLIALLLLEAVIHPSIHNWLMNLINLFHNVNSVMPTASGTQPWFQGKTDATGGITTSGVGYSKIANTNQADCLKQGGIWFNGECRKFSGMGANK